MKVRRSVLKDSVTVRTRTAEGSYGDVLADPITVPCLLDATRRVVRAGNGQETTSEVTLVLHPRSRATDADGGVEIVDPMDVFTEESEIVYDDRTSRVITAKRNKLRGYVVSVEVTCE